MKHGSLFTGYEALNRLRRGVSYHVTDVRGRAVFCDCVHSIRLGGRHKLVFSNKNIKAKSLTPLYREIRFHRNLNRAILRRWMTHNE